MSPDRDCTGRRALVNLAKGPDEVRLMVAKAPGAISGLVGCMVPDEPSMAEEAVRAVHGLAAWPDDVLLLVAQDPGVISGLMGCMVHSEPLVRQRAEGALGKLADTAS